MMCSISQSDDSIFYRGHLYEMADKIGVETVCFILDLLDIKERKLYDNLKRFLQIAKKYGPSILEEACTRANFYKVHSINVVRQILQYKLYLLPLESDTDIWGQRELDFNHKNMCC